MSTNLSRHFEQARIARGLTPGQLARLAGCQNPIKSGNKIRQFEMTGEITQHLFERLVAALGIDTATIERLAELDRREFFERWLTWVNEPITPYLAQRLIPAIWQQIPLPPEITTQDEAETWAAAVARNTKRKSCLVWSRRISIWFDESGDLVDRTEAVPDRANVPYTWIGGTKFTFGEDLRSVHVVDTGPRNPVDLHRKS